jgi:hypothetical protein
MSQAQSVYKTYTTQYFKTHFARILREMDEGHYDGAIITSHGRRVGVFFSQRKLAT